MTTTTDLDARRDNLAAHVETLTTARDAAAAEVDRLDAEHREAATRGDTGRAASLMAERRKRRADRDEAEADLTTACGWLADVDAERARLAAEEEAVRLAEAADLAQAEFRRSLADLASRAAERVDRLAALASEQAEDVATLGQAQGMTANALAAAGRTDTTSADMEATLTGSPTLHRAWLTRGRGPAESTALESLIFAARARPELRERRI